MASESTVALAFDSSDDAPIEFTLTETAWEALREQWLTTAEAGRLVEKSAAAIAGASRKGLVDGAVNVGGNHWLLPRSSVVAYAAGVAERTKQRAKDRERRRAATRVREAPRVRSVDAGPFLALLDARGGTRACGVAPRSSTERAIDRARVAGRLTHRMADRLAVEVLGLTMWEIWPDS